MKEKMTWSDSDENTYRFWLYQWSKNTGVPYDPNDPEYDYRKIYQLGLSPTWQPEHKEYRWPDIGKSKKYRGKGSVSTTPMEEMPSPFYQWIKESEYPSTLGLLKKGDLMKGKI